MRAILLLPIIIAVLAGAKAPVDVPIPTPNPKSPSATPNAAPQAVPNPKVPAPQSKPAAQKGTEPKSSGAAPMKVKSPDLPGISAPRVDEAALASCEIDLLRLGVKFERTDPVAGENGCGIGAPYAVTEIARGVALTPATQLRCATVLAMARWVDRVVLPATTALPGKVSLKAINQGTTYACRRRNNSATGKMSEHSIGNAIDVMSFDFDGRDPIAVSPRAGQGSIEEAYQRAVRGGACLHFTTVLGPGSDASHENHLHLDIAKRKRDYRLCE